MDMAEQQTKLGQTKARDSAIIFKRGVPKAAAKPQLQVEEIKEVEEEEDDDKEMPFDAASKKVIFRDQAGKGMELTQTFYFPKNKK